MKLGKDSLKEIAVITLGELIVFVLTCGGFYLSHLLFDTAFTYRVPLGAALGAAVIIINFVFLGISVNRAVDRFIAARGEREMTEEEAITFTAEHAAEIQNAIKLSFIVRTVSMLAALVVAFILLDVFSPIATAIPILMYRPVLLFGNLIKTKLDRINQPTEITAPFVDLDAVSDENNDENGETEKEEQGDV